MKDHFTKQPLEVFDISVDFSRVLKNLEFCDEGQSSVTAYDAEGNDVTADIIKGDFSETGGIMTQTIKGGESGNSYKITFIFFTTLLNTFEKDIKMDVIDS